MGSLEWRSEHRSRRFHNSDDSDNQNSSNNYRNNAKHGNNNCNSKGIAGDDVGFGV